MGAAVQRENYSLAAEKKSGWGRVHLGKIELGDEIPIPVREHLQMAQHKLKLNYLFWFMDPAHINEDVVKLLAQPDLAGDAAGGLETRIPPKAFLRLSLQNP